MTEPTRPADGDLLHPVPCTPLPATDLALCTNTSWQELSSSPASLCLSVLYCWFLPSIWNSGHFIYLFFPKRVFFFSPEMPIQWSTQGSVHKSTYYPAHSTCNQLHFLGGLTPMKAGLAALFTISLRSRPRMSSAGADNMMDGWLSPVSSTCWASHRFPLCNHGNRGSALKRHDRGHTWRRPEMGLDQGLV